MARTRRSSGLSRIAMLAVAILAVQWVGGVGLRAAGAQSFTTQGDDWKGTALDLTRWHTTVWGDAQTQPNAFEVKDLAFKIIAGGSDIWGDADHGVFANRVRKVAERFADIPAVVTMVEFIRAGGDRPLCKPRGKGHRKDDGDAGQ